MRARACTDVDRQADKKNFCEKAMKWPQILPGSTPDIFVEGRTITAVARVSVNLTAGLLKCSATYYYLCMSTASHSFFKYEKQNKNNKIII